MISSDNKIEIIKNAIRTEQGWANLAQSIKGAANENEAIQECISLLKIIGGETKVTVDESIVSLSDLLVDQLHQYLTTEEV